MKLNCAAIPTGLLESELFGHEKGAFTGADRAAARPVRAGRRRHPVPRRGRRHPARPPGQAAARPAGAGVRAPGQRQTMQVDVRLVAATNRDLPKMVAAGQFRSDLFYRLNVFPIRVPPLRERREDIPPSSALHTQVRPAASTSPVEHIPGAPCRPCIELRLARQHPRAGAPHRARGHPLHRDRTRPAPGRPPGPGGGPPAPRPTLPPPRPAPSTTWSASTSPAPSASATASSAGRAAPPHGSGSSEPRCCPACASSDCRRECEAISRVSTMCRNIDMDVDSGSGCGPTGIELVRLYPKRRYRLASNRRRGANHWHEIRIGRLIASFPPKIRRCHEPLP